MTIKQDLKSSTLPNYVELFVLDLTPIGGPVYRFTPSTAAGANSLVFGGNTYIPMPITGSGWETSIEGASPQPTLKVSNVTKYIQSDLSTYKDLVGARLTRYQTFDKYLDAASVPRRNLLNYSEQIDNGTWYKDNITVTANSALAPDGVSMTAETLTSTLTGGANNCFADETVSVSANTTYTYSVHVKAGTSPVSMVDLWTGGGPYSECRALVTWGTTPTISVSGTNNLGATISEAGNGWWRVALTLNSSTATNMHPRVYVRDQSSSNVTGHTVYMWGSQIEVGTVATPYQMTTTTHQPYADSSQVFNTCVYVIQQKTKQSKYEIEFKLSTIIDQPQMKLPRQQVLRTEFPGAGLFRKNA